jgi:hypothetical protein
MGQTNIQTPSSITRAAQNPSYLQFSPEKLAELQKTVVSQKKSQLKVEYDEFLTSVSPLNAGQNDSESAGLLRLGIKKVMDVYLVQAKYKPAGFGTKWCDISSSVHRVGQGTEQSTRWIKLQDAGRTNWSFDITVKGSKNETFAGIMTVGGTTMRWEGENKGLGFSELIEVSETDVQRPVNCQGTLDELLKDSTFATLDDGDTKQGADKAQKYADDLFQKVRSY